MKPLVSVIMPAYNAEQWIGEAIDSILNQTYDNIELLIYDDGSTDKTYDIIKKHQKINILEFFKENTGIAMYNLITDHKNRGITWSLNYLIRASSGKYIARMDADDIAMLDRIEKQVKYLRGLKGGFHGIEAVGCSIELFGDENVNEGREKWWGNSFSNTSAINEKLPYRNCICHPSVMFRTDVLKYYMYQGKGAFQDYDLFLRMTSDGLFIGKIRDTLLKYRVRNDSISAKNESDWAEIKLKLNFLIKKFPRWNKFDTHVMRSIWQIIRR